MLSLIFTFLLGISECVAADDVDRPITLYANEFTLPGLQMSSAERTIKAVEEAIAPRKLITKTVSLDEIDDVMENRKADMVIAGSAVYWRHINDGLRDIATLVTKEQPDPDHAVGSLILAREDDKRLSTLEDLRGKTIGINHQIGFQGYLTILKDIADKGYDPEKFFGKVIFYGQDPARRFEALRNKEVDAIAINVCYAERQIQQGNNVLAGFKPVAQRIPNETNCLASTNLYPNWTFLISPSLDAQTIVKVAKALYAMPSEPDGQYWTIASDYRGADDIYKTLKTEHYSYLKSWTIERIWDEFKLLICVTGALLIFLIWHYQRIQKLVDERTSELADALAEQKVLAKSMQDVTKRLENTRKAAIVSQLSSIVAHDLSQPLASINLYARAIKVLLGKGDISSKKEMLADATAGISEQAEKANQIVQQVRNYATAKQETFQQINLTQVLKKSVEGFVSGGRLKSSSLNLSLPEEPVFIFGSPLELELTFTNIIKNSLEAPNDQPLKLDISLHVSDNQRAVVTFLDNGNRLTEEDFEKIKVPLTSFKTEGLGLGLLIVHSVVEKHLGKVTIAQGQDRGLIVSISLPIKNNEEAANA